MGKTAVIGIIFYDLYYLHNIASSITACFTVFENCDKNFLKKKKEILII